MGNEYTPIVDPSLERPSTFDFTVDSAFLRGFGKEFSNRFLQNIQYFPLNFTASIPTNIYGEQDQDGTVWDEAFRIRASAEINPSKRQLEKWGIKEHRDIVFHVAIKVLEDENISPKVGDQILYENLYYKLTDVQVETREKASLRPLSIRMLANRTPDRETPEDAEV